MYGSHTPGTLTEPYVYASYIDDSFINVAVTATVLLCSARRNSISLRITPSADAEAAVYCLRKIYTQQRHGTL